MLHLLTFANLHRVNFGLMAVSAVIFMAGVAQFQQLIQSAINSVTADNWQENAKVAAAASPGSSAASNMQTLTKFYLQLNNTANFQMLSSAVAFSTYVSASRNMTTTFQAQPEIAGKQAAASR